MAPKDILQLIFIVLLIGGSAFFSSAETAYTMVNKIKLRSLADNGNKRAIKAAKNLEQTSKLISTILIGNNIVNIVVSSITTTWVLSVFGPAAAGISTAVLTVLLLIFGEVTPKTLASKNAESMAMAYANVIGILMVALSPVVFIIDKLSGFFLKSFRADKNGSSTYLTEAELRTMVAASHEAGLIEKSEKQIINNVIDFVDSNAKDVMVPRIDMYSVDINSGFDEVLDIFRESAHSRIPVYKDNPDNIVGILHSKDVLLSHSFNDPASKTRFQIGRLMRKPYFTFEMQNTSKLFKDMQLNSTSVAIVIDEYGAVAGMVTTQDLVEEIIGEIYDEYDEISYNPFVELSPGKFRVNGSYKIDDLNDKLECELESDENDSIGGLIIEQLDRFPRAGDSIEQNGIRATVMKTANKRIETVLVEQLNEVNKTIN